jgi:hypothetical protein
VATLESGRVAALLSATEVELGTAEAELAAARAEAERLDVLAVALGERAATLERAERVAALRREVEDAEREAAEVTAALGREYPRLAREIAALLARETAAEARCRAVAERIGQAGEIAEGITAPASPASRYWESRTTLAMALAARVCLPGLASSGTGFWPSRREGGQ